MEISINVKKTFEVSFLKVTAKVKVGNALTTGEKILFGLDCIDGNLPFFDSKTDIFSIIIDIETGQIINWGNDFKEDVCVYFLPKIKRGETFYSLLDCKMENIKDFFTDAPSCLSISKDDFIYIFVSNQGFIKNWDFDKKYFENL